MRKTTKGHGLPGAVLITAVVVLVMLLFAADLLSGYFTLRGVDVFVAGLMIVYALLCLAAAVGIVVALVQRWREVRGGEEDEAKKY